MLTNVVHIITYADGWSVLSEIVLDMDYVTYSLIDWAYTQNDGCIVYGTYAHIRPGNKQTQHSNKCAVINPIESLLQQMNHVAINP